MKQILVFLTLTVSVNAQTIKLDFEPKGQVIKFYFDSLIIYTDTASLFSVYAKEGGLKDYDLRVKNFVLGKSGLNKNDTIIFSGNFIPFNDGIENRYQEDWYVEWAILHLTKEKKVKIYDKHGQLVKMIVMKKVGKKRTNFVKRSYINKATQEELLKEVLFMRIVDPVF